MTDGSVPAAVDAEGSESAVEPLVAVYRHDVHKARSRGHEAAASWFGGTRVNEEVPLGADGDAALLSRPRGSPEQTMDAHASWRRLSVLTGEVVSTSASGTVEESLRELVEITDAEAAHAAWLGASVPAAFSESPYYPYTSLKFHTLLAAALLDNYRAGFEFDELFLAVSEHSEGVSPEVVPHRTVLVTSAFSLHVTGEPGDWPAVRIGARSARSFADTWARLPTFPFDVDGERWWRVLDAQLRRIRSWSTALQYVEEFVAAFTSATSGAVLGDETRGV